MTFLVSIDKFEGPLDLMLHLIKEKELDLFNLDMDVLVDQYIEYLKQMEDLHLDIAGDYLAELAGLLEYKSRALLPKPQDDDDLDTEDPKEKLVRRLIEYQRFKDVATVLSERYQQRSLQLAKTLSSEADDWIQDYDLSEVEGNPYDLMKAMNRCLRHLALSKPLATKVTPNRITVEEVITVIHERFDGYAEPFSFRKMVEETTDIVGVIMYFLAILDLIKDRTMIYTIDNDEDIWLKWSEVHE